MLNDGNYTPVARHKIAELIRRPEFASIDGIDSNRLQVKIRFSCGKTCTVDSWGKVLWQLTTDQ